MKIIFTMTLVSLLLLLGCNSKETVEESGNGNAAPAGTVQADNSASVDTIATPTTVSYDWRVIHKDHPRYRYPTTPHFQVSIRSVSAHFTRDYFKDSLDIDVSFDTLKYSDISKFAEYPPPDGSKAGFHDPYTGCYYTGSFDSYLVFNAAEIYGDLILSREYHVDSLIEAKAAGHNAKSLHPFGRYVIWLPDSSRQPYDSEFHPENFDGIRRLKRHEIEPPDVTAFHWLLDSLRGRGLPADSPTDSIVYKEGCAGDDSGDIDYYRLRYTSLSEELKSRYDIIVKRTDTLYRIMGIAKNVSHPKRLSYEETRQWEKRMGFYRGIAEDKESLTIMGPVDLMFDGRYEIMIYRNSSMQGGTFGDWSYYIMDEDGKVIGVSEGGSSC